MAHYFSPFAVWYAWSMLREPSGRRWALLVSLCAMQILAGLHLGWFLVFGLSIFFIWGLVVEPGSLRRLGVFIRRYPIAVLLPVAIAGVAVGLYARNFYRGAPSPRAYWEAAMYCPYIDGWFVATPGSLWADHLTYRHWGAFPEKALFQGFAVYAVFLLAGWHAWRSRFPGRGLVLAGLGTALVLAILGTRWGYNFSLWYVVHQLVPGANAFRAIGRIAYSVYLFGLIGGLVGVQALVDQRISREKTRCAIYAVLFAFMVAEQVRPFPEYFDKEEQFFAPARSLVQHLDGVDTAYVVFDESMPPYRHDIAAMWAGLWAKVPVMNGFSGTIPPGHPIGVDFPDVEQLVRALGPNWRGKLAVIEWGPPIRRRVYQVEPGDDASERFRLIDGP
jgi:hypothetical protein